MAAVANTSAADDLNMAATTTTEPADPENGALLAHLDAELSAPEQRLFVRSFYLALHCDEERDMVVSLDDTCRFIDVRKDSAKRTLVKHFEEGVHYRVDRVFHTGVENLGGRPSEVILMTPDTFKELCMLSDTPRGREVRQYYIRMEKVLKAYLREQARTAQLLLVDNRRALEDEKRAAAEAAKQLAEQAAELERYRTKTYEEVPRLDKVYVDKDAAQLGTDKHKLGTAISESKRESQLNTALADGGKMIYVRAVSNGKLVEDIAKFALKRYHWAREHYCCRVEHTVDVFDIAGVVVDTLASSYEFITRDELFQRVTDNLFAEMHKDADDGECDVDDGGSSAESEAGTCDAQHVAESSDSRLDAAMAFIDKNVVFNLPRRPDQRGHRVLGGIKRTELIARMRNATDGGLWRGLKVKAVKDIVDKAMLSFGRPFTEQFMMGGRPVTDAYKDCAWRTPAVDDDPLGD